MTTAQEDHFRNIENYLETSSGEELLKQLIRKQDFKGDFRFVESNIDIAREAFRDLLRDKRKQIQKKEYEERKKCERLKRMAQDEYKRRTGKDASGKG